MNFQVIVYCFSLIHLLTVLGIPIKSQQNVDCTNSNSKIDQLLDDIDFNTILNQLIKNRYQTSILNSIQPIPISLTINLKSAENQLSTISNLFNKETIENIKSDGGERVTEEEFFIPVNSNNKFKRIVLRTKQQLNSVPLHLQQLLRYKAKRDGETFRFPVQILEDEIVLPSVSYSTQTPVIVQNFYLNSNETNKLKTRQGSVNTGNIVVKPKKFLFTTPTPKVSEQLWTFNDSNIVKSLKSIKSHNWEIDSVTTEDNILIQSNKNQSYLNDSMKQHNNSNEIEQNESNGAKYFNDSLKQRLENAFTNTTNQIEQNGFNQTRTITGTKYLYNNLIQTLKNAFTNS